MYVSDMMMVDMCECDNTYGFDRFRTRSHVEFRVRDVIPFHVIDDTFHGEFLIIFRQNFVR